MWRAANWTGIASNLTLDGSIKQGSGYQHLASLSGTDGSDISVTFKLRDTEGSATVTCRSDAPLEFIVGTCPDNPADETMGVILLRKKAMTAAGRNEITVR